MIPWIADVLAIASSGAVVNSAFRIVLSRASSRGAVPAAEHVVTRWLVVIPARDEGDLIRPTLESIRDAGLPDRARVLVALDGKDAVAERIGKENGFDVRIKEPAGPTKGAVLKWLVAEHRDLLLDAEAVLLLDVGSKISRDFFPSFRWPDDSAAVQCFLTGEGIGAGRAAAASENFAQRREDVGRERLGWNIQLRGTATVFRPDTFIQVVPKLATQIEDFEASLLLTASGERLMMARGNSFATDEKPRLPRDATLQRARWMAGQVEVLLKHWRPLVHVIRNRPAEGVAFLGEIFGRPVSLTILLRLIAATFLLIAGTPVRVIVAAMLLASVAADVLVMRLTTRFQWRDSAALVVSWLQAVAEVPRALTQWRRARKS